jgi:Sulfotransferase family
MTKPNLFIIGSAKCGTTTMHDVLAAHPQIFMSKFKDPAFFLGKTGPLKRLPAMSDKYRNNPDEYFALFADAGDRPLAGESSTTYSNYPHYGDVAERIHRFNPGAKFIYILRDPIERTISHYWWYVRHEGEKRDMMTAIAEDPYYCNVSNYAMQLKPYLTLFGPSQIKVLTLESLAADTNGVLADLFSWLGVDPSRYPKGINIKENVTPREVVHIRNLRMDSFRYSRLWNTIGPAIPRFVRRFGRKLLEKRIDRTAVATEPVEKFLRPRQLKETQELSQMIGREFPEWRTLYGNVK